MSQLKSRLFTRRSIGLAAAALCFTLASHAADDSQRVIMMFKPGAAAAGKAAVAAARGVVKHEIYGMDAVSIEVPAQALQGLARNPNVEYVEPDEKRYLSALDTPSTGVPYALGQRVPYGIAMVQADQFAGQDLGSRKVCIIDSGYDSSHEDASHVSGEYDSGTGWWYTDENHHGSHVAGTISALNNAAGVVGVSSNKTLRLHIVKVFGKDGWAYSSSLTTAANKCKAAGAHIISMSLGGPRMVKTAQRAFDALDSGGTLSIAAAGNDGNSTLSYPASYSSVMSVAAVDANKQWASFSQYNSQVEIAAPGVGVLSTVPMGAGRSASLTVAATAYAPGGMDGSPVKTASGALADFGIGDAVLGGMSGKVCLIQRGTVDFATKVTNCRTSGGVAAVIYNNAAGGFGGALGTTATSIPSLTASDVEGAAMKLQLGQAAIVAVTASNYAHYDGTSMATPHVSAVAALVWARNSGCTAAQLRSSLNLSAEDLGPVGRDTKHGDGLVRAKAADDRIKAMGCGR